MTPDTVMARYHVERVSDRRSIHRGQVEPHRHPHLHQLTYWIAGGGEYQIEAARHTIAPGSLCWIPAGYIHGFSVGPQTDAIVLSLARDYVGEDLAAIAQGSAEAVLRHACVICPEREYAEELHRIFACAEREYARSVWGAQDVLSALATHIFVIVGRHQQDLTENWPLPKHHLFQRLEACVERRFREHPTVHDLANELGSTPYLLNQASRAATGLKISDYVRSRAMHEAQRLLLFTAVDIAEVSILVGYSDPSHFTRTFRAFHSETPRDWRDRHTRI